MTRAVLPLFLALLLLVTACSEDASDPTLTDTDTGVEGPLHDAGHDLDTHDLEDADLAPDAGDEDTGDGPDTGDDPDAGDDPDTGEDPDGGEEPDPTVPDYSEIGPFSVTSTTGSMDTGDGCNMSYTRFSPQGVEADVLVVLAHGFARGQAQMAGWGEHMASWGLEVVTPQMCYLQALNTNHPANGRTLANLARGLADQRPVVLAGHSAGGLAATLAASEGGFTALLGLDPVDNNNLGQNVAADLSLPAAALIAEPGSCNSSANGQGMFDPIPGRSLYRIDGTNHCSFENPTDFLCASLCGASSADADAVELALSALITAFAFWHGAGETPAAAWWTPGFPEFDSVAPLLTEL